LDTSDIDLQSRVVEALISGGNARRAEPFVIRVADAHPDYLPLAWQRWRVTSENKSWARATTAGEILLSVDSMARRDSLLYLRLATAYKLSDNPLKAVETLARGLTLFPRDARLYSLYAQYIRAEADTVLPRGLALFPE